MELSSESREAANTDYLNAEAAARKKNTSDRTAGAYSYSVAGRAQGIALKSGKGKVVRLGEAALFSAQVVTLPRRDGEVVFKAGMNVPGNDNRQFALNVLRWLSGLLE